jgi:hypothetical protein
MNAKKLCLIKLQSIDLINEQILSLEKNKQKIYLEISYLKESIILENQIFINQRAIVEHPNGKQSIMHCLSVRCSEDFEPIFQFNNKEERNKLTFVGWVS